MEEPAPEDDAGYQRRGDQQIDHAAQRIAHHHVPGPGDDREQARHRVAAPVIGLNRVFLTDSLGGIHAGPADEDIDALRTELLAGARVGVAALAHFATAALAAPAG